MKLLSQLLDVGMLQFGGKLFQSNVSEESGGGIGVQDSRGLFPLGEASPVAPSLVLLLRGSVWNCSLEVEVTTSQSLH